MSPAELTEKVESLKGTLVAWATGDQSDRPDYAELRRELLQHPTVGPSLPSFVRTCRTRLEFWGFIQPKFGRYAERREFIREAFDELLAKLEGIAPPIAEANQAERVTPMPVEDPNSALLFFISHSSKDVEIAEALADLTRAAFGIHASQIRCTSVNGYRLRVGSRTDDTLRQEVNDASAFIGIITEISIESAYVLFELGARWGAQKHLAPVLAAGATHSLLKGPLGGINALSCGDVAQVHQLITDLGHVVGKLPGAAASYHKYVDRLVDASRKAESRTAKSGAGLPASASASHLNDLHLQLLAILGDRDGKYTDVSYLVGQVGKPRALVEFHLKSLQDGEFLERHPSLIGEDDGVSISHPGRKLLIERGHFK